MKIETKLLKYIKNYIKKVQAENEAARLAEKQRVLRLLFRTWTKEQIYDFNLDIIANSAGWMGGDYDEIDIKKLILRKHYNKLTQGEIDQIRIEVFKEEDKTKIK